MILQRAAGLQNYCLNNTRVEFSSWATKRSGLLGGSVMCKEAFQNCPASLLRGERMLVIPVFSAGPQALLNMLRLWGLLIQVR